jgi:hypothetical protein
MKRKIIVGVSGYARSGKDTFADILEECLPEGVEVARLKFANPLRRALNESFKHLEVDANPWTEDNCEKEALRPLLVSLGEFARSKNPEVFAAQVAKESANLLTKEGMDLVVITDLRYANELKMMRELARKEGFDFYWVSMVKIGNQPANATEFKSFMDMHAQDNPDWECFAGDGELNLIRMLAKDFARTVLPHDWFTTSRNKSPEDHP